MIPHIHHRSFGTGPRQALAIHCTLAHSGAWRGFGVAVSDHVTLHAFDLPNHGKSGDWDGVGDLHDTATAMARWVLDTLGPGPIDLIGHSFGGTVALRLAIETPDKVRSATLFEPVFFAPAIADDPEFAARYADVTAAHDAAVQSGDDLAATRAFMGAWGGGIPWEAIPQETRDYMVERIGFVRDSGPFVTGDSAGLMAPGRFAQATCPMMLMRGADSPWMGPVNDAIVQRLPNAENVVMPGMGHMGPVMNSADVAAKWMAFLGRA